MEETQPATTAVHNLPVSSMSCLLRQLAFLSRAVGELVRRNLRNAPWQSFT